MSGTARRQPGTWVTVLAGLVAVWLWGSNAFRAAFGEGDLSTRALFTYFSLVLIGLAIATLLYALMSSVRAIWHDSHAIATVADQFLLSLMVLGFGAGPVLSTSPGAWDWAILVLGSLVGGLTLGAAFVAASHLQRTAPGRAPDVQPPARYDWW